MASVLQPLTDVLDRELAAGTLLLDALDGERACLVGGEPEALESAVATKEKLLAELHRLEAERHAALAALGFPADRAGVTACLQAHEDPNYRDDASRAGPAAARWRRLLAVTAQQKNLELFCSISADLPRRFVGDPIRIRQVLTQLVSNALKFTHAGRIEGFYFVAR